MYAGIGQGEATLSLLSPNWDLMPSDLTNLDIFIVSFIVRFSFLSGVLHVTVNVSLLSGVSRGSTSRAN